MTARASIIITNFNYGRFVTSAVDSALAQIEPCEVIVVDDGSTDDSLERLEPYRDRVRVVTQANGGQGSAFNTGFLAATAPVVFFLDGDDRLLPAAVATVLDAFDRHPEAGRVQFRLGWIDAVGRITAGGFPEPERALPAGDLVERLAINPADIPWQPTSGNAFRARVLAELLPMPTGPYRVSADHYLSNLSPLYGPVVGIEETLGSYRVHGANLDHRGGFDLDRARDILVRTAVTNSHLIQRGRSLGVAMPASTSGFRSLSEAALRLASFRSAPRRDHPFGYDRRTSLVASALRAALHRTDLTIGRRVLAVGWVLALAAVPGPFVGRVAGLGLTR